MCVALHREMVQVGGEVAGGERHPLQRSLVGAARRVLRAHRGDDRPVAVDLVLQVRLVRRVELARREVDGVAGAGAGDMGGIDLHDDAVVGLDVGPLRDEEDVGVRQVGRQRVHHTRQLLTVGAVVLGVGAVAPDVVVDGLDDHELRRRRHRGRLLLLVDEAVDPGAVDREVGDVPLGRGVECEDPLVDAVDVGVGARGPGVLLHVGLRVARVGVVAGQAGVTECHDRRRVRRAGGRHGPAGAGARRARPAEDDRQRDRSGADESWGPGHDAPQYGSGHASVSPWIPSAARSPSGRPGKSCIAVSLVMTAMQYSAPLPWAPVTRSGWRPASGSACLARHELADGRDSS